jgi:hypothetical protein
MPARLFELYESLREANEEERIHEAAESAVTDYLAGERRPAARMLGEAHALLREVVSRARPVGPQSHDLKRAKERGPCMFAGFAAVSA